MRAALLVAMACGLSACATITRGTTDSWTINSTPGGASVKTSTGFSCEATPCTFRMPRKSGFDVTVTKTGYKAWQGHVDARMAGAGGAGFLGNALVGGIIGAGVDASSGAMLNLTPNPLNVDLQMDAPKVAAVANPAPAAVGSAIQPASYVSPAAKPGNATPAPATVAAKPEQPRKDKRCPISSPDNPEAVSC